MIKDIDIKKLNIGDSDDGKDYGVAYELGD